MFKEPYLEVFFKWVGEGFEGIQDKIPLQTLIINSPESGEFGGVKGTGSTYIFKKLNCQLCPYDANLYMFL